MYLYRYSIIFMIPEINVDYQFSISVAEGFSPLSWLWRGAAQRVYI